MDLRQPILDTLAYFDLFDYPLTMQEIQSFSNTSSTSLQIEAGVDDLLRQGVIFSLGDTFSLHNDLSLLKRRREGNAHAQQLMKRAIAVANTLKHFPFVRAIGVSGSLSKNFASPDADIDFFIITAPGKLWLCRSLLHGLKKLSYLSGRQHDLCMNYFIDEDELEIREQNIYTAIEVVTVIPLWGETVFGNFYAANTWTNAFLPNKYMRLSQGGEINKPVAIRFLEYIVKNKLGNVIDISLMKMTKFRWRLKTKRGQANQHGFTLSLDAGRHYAKPDPGNFQSHLLHQYDTKKTYVSNLLEEIHENKTALPF